MNKLDLVDKPYGLTIVQGATYNKLILRLDGDYSNANFKAEIRRASLESGGELLATFSFQQINYDPVENKTTVVPVLTASQTSAIPSTRFNGTGEATIRNCWVWDFEAVLADNVDKIPISLVQVTAEVTA